MLYYDTKEYVFGANNSLCSRQAHQFHFNYSQGVTYIYLCLDLQIYLVAFYLFPACSSASKSISITPIWRCTCQLYFPSLSLLLRKVHSNFLFSCFYICLSFCLYHFLYFTKTTNCLKGWSGWKMRSRWPRRSRWYRWARWARWSRWSR